MILITGGAGFIGANLAAAWNERSAAVPLIITDVLGTAGKWQNLKNREIYRLYRPDELETALTQHGALIDTVFHLGAISSTTEIDADAIAKNNIRLSQQLWHWCAEHGKRFIYASSASVYGDGSSGFRDGASLEQMRFFTPLNAYAWSKLAFDRYVARELQNGQKTPRQWAGLRFFNVYGANEYHKGSQQSVVPQFLRQITDTGRCRLFKSGHIDYADGAQKRDFVAVDDCVRVMLWLYENPKVSGIFNVGSGQARTFVEMAGAIFATLLKPPQLDFIDMPEGLKKGYQYFTEADLSSLRRAGYTEAMTPLEVGVADYVQRFLTKADPYR